jgi:hypothetical protein
MRPTFRRFEFVDPCASAWTRAHSLAFRSPPLDHAAHQKPATGPAQDGPIHDVPERRDHGELFEELDIEPTGVERQLKQFEADTPKNPE